MEVMAPAGAPGGEPVTGPAIGRGRRLAVPLRERVRAALEELVVSGVLPPGQHLVEEELAQRLGVSRNPIREGFQQLAAAGFVELRPGRGAFVRVPTPREIDEVFHVRMLLEGESARLAAERITIQTLERLEAVLERGREAVPAGDPRELLELNSRFHDLIITAADNSVMASTLTALSRRIRWYFASVVVRRAPVSWSEHQDVFEALVARDGPTAGELMSTHVGQTRQALRFTSQDDDEVGAGEPQTPSQTPS